MGTLVAGFTNSHRPARSMDWELPTGHLLFQAAFSPLPLLPAPQTPWGPQLWAAPLPPPTAPQRAWPQASRVPCSHSGWRETVLSRGAWTEWRLISPPMEKGREREKQWRGRTGAGPGEGALGPALPAILGTELVGWSLLGTVT